MAATAELEGGRIELPEILRPNVEIDKAGLVTLEEAIAGRRMFTIEERAGEWGKVISALHASQDSLALLIFYGDDGSDRQWVKVAPAKCTGYRSEIQQIRGLCGTEALPLCLTGLMRIPLWCSPLIFFDSRQVLYKVGFIPKRTMGQTRKAMDTVQGRLSEVASLLWSGESS